MGLLSQLSKEFGVQAGLHLDVVDGTRLAVPPQLSQHLEVLDRGLLIPGQQHHPQAHQQVHGQQVVSFILRNGRLITEFGVWSRWLTSEWDYIGSLPHTCCTSFKLVGRLLQTVQCHHQARQTSHQLIGSSGSQAWKTGRGNLKSFRL